jgi:hypothetical protein
MNSANSIFYAQQQLRLSGEPDWMPSHEEVTRARARLEREGVVSNLARGIGGPQLVGPGQTPWLWWVGAVLWLVLWPAVIALRVGLGKWPWLPWWLPLLIAAFHMLVLIGPVVYSERLASRGELRQRFGRVQTLAQMLALEPAEFEIWTGMLFQLIGYQVRNTRYGADHGIDLEVTNDRVAVGLVQCKRYRGTVGEPAVRDLYGTITHERADFGWLVTTGAISRQARAWADGKSMELWDGQKLVELARQCR